MTILTEAPRPGEAIISQAPGTRSREAIAVMASQTLLANQVIGRTASAATVAAAVAAAGNTGNGVLTLAGTPFTAAVQPGAYRVTFIEPVTNLGTFIVESPEGLIVGRGVVGAAYSGHVAFTIADGATDFVAGDTFTITVHGRSTHGAMPWAGENTSFIAYSGLVPMSPYTMPSAVRLRPASARLLVADCISRP